MRNKMKNFAFEGFRLHKDLRYWDFPEHFSLEITNRCNLRCSHCFQSHFSFPRGDLKKGVWERLKGHLGQVRSVSLSGAGEPLVAADFVSFFEECKRLGLVVGFTTNAIFLEKHLERLVGRLDQLFVSIDAIAEEIYRRRRGVSPAPVLRALRKLHALKRNRKTERPEIFFITVLNRENVAELPSLVELAAQVGAAGIYAYHQIFYTEEAFRKSSLWFARELYDRILRRALLRAQKLGVTLIHPGSFDGEIPPHSATRSYLVPEGNGFRCNWIFHTFTVSWNGFVQACCFCDRLFMGNVFREDLWEIWNGPTYRYLRLRFLRNERPPECQNCQFLQVFSLHQREAFLCPHYPERLYSEKALLPASGFSLRAAEDLYRQGLAALQEGQPETAAKLFSRILERESLYFEAANALGVAFAILGKRERAEETFREALKLFPKEPSISHNLKMLSVR